MADESIDFALGACVRLKRHPAEWGFVVFITEGAAGKIAWVRFASDFQGTDDIPFADLELADPPDYWLNPERWRVVLVAEHDDLMEALADAEIAAELFSPVQGAFDRYRTALSEEGE